MDYVTDAAAKSSGAAFAHEIVAALQRDALDAQRTLDGEVVMETKSQSSEEATQRTIPLAEVAADLEDRVTNLGIVPSTSIEWIGIKRVVGAFLSGATGGDDQDSMVWGERRAFHAAKGIEQLVLAAYNNRRLQPTYTFTEVLLPDETQTAPRDVGHRMRDPYENKRYFEGWSSHLLPCAAFDAETTEWRLADILDRASGISWWLRLRSSDPVYIETDAGKYYPDFIGLEKSTNIYWLIEGKSDKDLKSVQVQAKRRAALEWAEVVNADARFGEWKYLLCSESAIKRSGGNWETLVRLATIDTLCSDPSVSPSISTN